MKRIRIPSKTHGTHYALVDEEDFGLVSRYRWYLSKTISKTSGDVSFYAQTSIRKENGGQRTLRMHRLVLRLGFGDKRYVDHINYKTLDNRRCNLRPCSPLESVLHRKKMGGTSSKYKGVSSCQRHEKYVSQITVEGKPIRLGNFKTQKEAAIQYDRAAYAMHGEFAELNFPKTDHSNDNFDIEEYETPAQKNKSSKYVCVYWSKRANKWASAIKSDKKRAFLGYFKNEKTAAQAYDDYVIKHNLNRKLNFKENK